MADLETIKAQELKFLKYCQGLKPEDKLYNLLMAMDNPTWEKALVIIRKHEIAECVKAEIGDGKTTKHALNSVSGKTRAGSQSPKRKNEKENRGRDKKSKEETQNKTGGRAEARVDPDFATSLTKWETIGLQTVPNQGRRVLQMREGVTHHILDQEETHLREKKEKPTRAQTHSE